MAFHRPQSHPILGFPKNLRRRPVNPIVEHYGVAPLTMKIPLLFVLRRHEIVVLSKKPAL
jgi:hypothetical protein